MTSTDPRPSASPDLAGYVAMLEDAVVGAAVLWFGEVERGSSEEGYLSECLHLTASDLVSRVPRLKGAYKGAEEDV